MKFGTWTTRPVSVVAGFSTFVTVALLSPGAVSVTRWTTFITRQRSFWWVMIMLARSWVAGINIGRDSLARAAPGRYIMMADALLVCRSRGRRGDGCGRARPTREPARGLVRPSAPGHGVPSPG